MEITQQINGDVLDLKASGRVDGYWADHLERALAEAVSAGHHRVRLDCADIGFMSSAGIAVLMKFRKELSRIDGVFSIVNPSKPVASTLALARLSDLLIERAPAAGTAPAPAARQEAVVRKRETADATYEIFDLDTQATLTCRTIGDARQLQTGGFTDAHVLSGAAPPAFAVGIGAFGDGFDDCRARFGELLSVAGATVYLPADGTNVPDYLVSRGDVASDVRLLYGLASAGRFARVVRFETRPQGAPLHLSSVLGTCLDIAGSPAIGIAIVAETVGLVGAALRRSPVDPADGGDFFAHPGVRDRLAFTAEPAFPRGVALAAGVVARDTAVTSGGAADGATGTLRPLGPGCVGHLHAAAFPFRAIKKGRIDLADTVSALFEADQPLGVLHLLHDDRASAGAGESELVRGACWLAPLTGEW